MAKGSHVRAAGCLLLVMLHAAFPTSRADASDLQTKSGVAISGVTVDATNLSVFTTPLAWYKGCLYTVNVEPPTDAHINKGYNLRTVVRKGVLSHGTWQWTEQLIEDRTMVNQWHTQASIGVDKEGFIHVAYNMQSMPWQYKVSKRPEDISEFVFRGDPVTLEQIALVKDKNLTPFVHIGTAAIPGNQITYPAFYNDRQGELFIRYKFTLRPKRGWKERAFAGAVARYDCTDKKWMPIGGDFDVHDADADLPAGLASVRMHPFAYHPDWMIYLITLYFDAGNRMHACWMWREGGAGPDCNTPSYVCMDKGYKEARNAASEPCRLPAGDDIAKIRIAVGGDAGGLNKYKPATSLAVDPQGQPWLIVWPAKGPALLVHYDKALKKWSEPEKTPWSAYKIYIEDNGTQWVFAGGVNIFKRKPSSGQDWVHVYQEQGFTNVKVLPVPEKRIFFIHVQDTSNMLKVFWVSMDSGKIFNL